MACNDIRKRFCRRIQALLQTRYVETCEELTAGVSPAAAAAAAAAGGPSASIAIREGPASFDFFPPFFFGLRMAVVLLRLLPLLRSAVGPSAAAAAGAVVLLLLLLQRELSQRRMCEMAGTIETNRMILRDSTLFNTVEWSTTQEQPTCRPETL
jgi:hypothetical protein